MSLQPRNSQARLEVLGLRTRVAETCSRIALAAFRGFINEDFTTDDPAQVDDTSSASSTDPSRQKTTLQVTPDE